MTRTVSTDSGISLTTNLHAVAEMLDYAKPHIVLPTVAKSYDMPRNKKTQIQFRRISPFSAKTTPLAEGVTPNATQFSYAKVNATLRQYGRYVEITDVIEDTAEDPVLRDASMELGEDVGRTEEALTWATVRAGTGVSYTGGAGSRAAVNSVLTLNDIRGVVRTLRNNKAKPITRVIRPGANFNTVPVAPAYVCFTHTDMAADIRSLAGFTPAEEYASRNLIHDNELGKVEEVRFVCSADLDPFTDIGGTAATNGVVSTTGTDADVYPMVFCGAEAFGVVHLKDHNGMDLIVNQVNAPDKSDPLNQRGTVGYKLWHASLVLNQAWMHRLESAATDLG